jgi:hypothetical protein
MRKKPTFPPSTIGRNGKSGVAGELLLSVIKRKFVILKLRRKIDFRLPRDVIDAGLKSAACMAL